MIALAALLVTSCGIIDIELDEEQMDEIKMYLDRDTIYAMVGDELVINPHFSPDTAIVNDVFWTSSADSVLHIDGYRFTALSEGWATVKAVSVMNQIEDSCHVCVLPRWDTTVPSTPYETIIYADVTVHGKAFDPETMMLAAYVGNELRGIGTMREQHGVKYMEIRVGSEQDGEDSADPEEDPIIQFIKFRVYDKSRFMEEEVPGFVLFDGAAHGTLSNLYKIEIK